MTEVEILRAAMRETFEVWAGSDGIPIPVTASEAYLIHLIEQMRDIAAKHMTVEEPSKTPSQQD